MSIRRLFLFLVVAAAFLLATGIPTKSQYLGLGLFVGRNVNLAPYPQTDPDTDELMLDTGDPYLQRQNEPSMAVSTRNPMHLLAAANDYRTVYVPFSEGPLPGIDLRASASGDAWVGMFTSYNSGQSWTTHILPGYPQDITPEGIASPLHEYSTACDPTVRAGSSGLFFTSGIVFDRVKNGESAIFVARYIDNNTQAIGETDSIEYIDVNIIDEGTSGQFADKPWIAVAAPSDENDIVTIDAPSYTQTIPRFDVYMVYSIFLGSSPSGDHSKIMFAKSSDCGNSWGKPIKLSEDVHICQGTNVVVSPYDGTIYIVWRQYAREEYGIPHAIIMCKSTDGGLTFTKANMIAEIDPFDQYTAAERFRTSAFPAIAVDRNGLVYVAWSQLGVEEGTLADVPRIVIKTTLDGEQWSDPTPIDSHQGRGHQIMPSLACAGGTLLATWYDTRNSLWNELPEIIGEGQTMDVRAAQANLSTPSLPYPDNPAFGDSVQVSRYLYTAVTDPITGDLLDANGDPIHISGLPPVIKQVQSSHPNYAMFEGGYASFMGDYIDSAPSPMIMRDYESGTWRFNTGEGEFDPTLCYIVFACNRDVTVPEDPDWTIYQPPNWPPGSGNCIDDITAGMRNQNIYTAPVTQGIQVGCPVNTKPLYGDRRTFLVFVRNLTDNEKLIRLTIDIDATPGMNASFWEFETPIGEECPFEYCSQNGRIVDVSVFPHSSITLTVFVQPYTDPLATFRVTVEEASTGLKSSVILNPDPVNTGLIDPEQVLEYDAPFVITEDLALADFGDATVFSEDVVFTPEVLAELLESSNPDILTPCNRHPLNRHDAIINPLNRHSSIGSAPDGQVAEVTWSVQNQSDNTSAYSFEIIGDDPSVASQLLIYRVTSTPMPDGCDLSEEEHHELVLSYENPLNRHPLNRHGDLRNPLNRHNTFFLAPGETAICTLRLIDPEPTQESGGSTQEAAIMSNGGTQEDFIPEDYATRVAGVVIPQAANADGIIELETALYIVADPLPVGSVGDTYTTTTLEAYGGEPFDIIYGDPDDPDDDVWKYRYWTEILQNGESMLPPGLTLSSDGIISGSPVYDPNATYPQDYSFTVEVKDESDPQQVARRTFNISIGCDVNIEATAGPGGSIDPEGDVTVLCGDSQTFTIIPDDCFHIQALYIDGVPLSQVPVPTTYKFASVNQDHTIHATFERDTFIIKAAAGVGGSIDPEGDVTVFCGLDQTFTITVDEGYMLEDVLVNGTPEGPMTSYTFINVRSDHTITAIFKSLEKWVQRYNNDSANGADEANDIGVDQSGENVYVTGYSSNGTDNDYATINYLSNGTPNPDWGTTGVLRYDGGEGNDEASALALDGSGNVYVTGYSFSFNKGEDFYTISYDSSGVERLSARYDGPAHKGDKGNDIVVDASGDFYVTGDSFRGMKYEHSDYATVKFDTLGEIIWDERYDARRNGHDVATAAALDLEGNVIITGRSEYSLNKNIDVLHYDYFTIKYNANNGSVAWADRYDNRDVANARDEAAAIAVDLYGNIYVTGRSQGSGLDFDIVTIKYSSNGERLWVKRYNYGPANGNDEAVAIGVDALGNVYVTGYSFNGMNNDYVTIMYSSTGEELWVERYDNSGDDEAADIAIDTAGNIYVTGRSQDGGDFNYFTIKYDSSGNMVWRVRYDSTFGDDEARALVIDALGNVYVTGRSKGMIGGVATGFDFATVKYGQ
ncbi:MAG: hypothetical protein GTN73_00665 [Candidatus Aminicenantes bacterium]|nr:hypothetical protein [Candidatus Aminicenantes bacterium]